MTSPQIEIQAVIEARPRDLGDFAVRRLLPTIALKHVGPFVFFDHMGPAEFAPGKGIDVRPHPHINLATVTYLFEGAILHRDSLGSEQLIGPGEINWMTAGRGIVHSERTPPELRTERHQLHGIQLWIALPKEAEEVEPAFFHHPTESFPIIEIDRTELRVLLGAAYGTVSPVAVFSSLFYAEARMRAGTTLLLPTEYAERAAYIAEGKVTVGDIEATVGEMLVFSTGARPLLRAETPTRLVILGGAPLSEPRHIYWNFVSSSLERIEQAKRDWREGRFPKVPGDEVEFIPLPD